MMGGVEGSSQSREECSVRWMMDETEGSSQSREECSVRKSREECVVRKMIGSHTHLMKRPVV
jgi:hypothetical protein